jgi:hypothetical protein
MDRPISGNHHAAGKLRARTFSLDGEAVVCGADGIAVFDALHGQRRLREAFLYAFDMIEMDGEDLRHWPFSERKMRLERLLAGRNAGIVLNQHVVEKGAVVFAAACRMGLEGNVLARCALLLRAFTRLDQDQESGFAGDAAGAGRAMKPELSTGRNDTHGCSPRPGVPATPWGQLKELAFPRSGIASSRGRLGLGSGSRGSRSQPDRGLSRAWWPGQALRGVTENVYEFADKRAPFYFPDMPGMEALAYCPCYRHVWLRDRGI